jgi:hypothetical protein
VVTPDLERTKTYYNRVLGWKYRDLESGPERYPTILSGGVPQGGMLTTAQLGMPEDGARVMAYVSVPDVDAAASAARDLGGRLVAEPLELPALGRLAVLTDPAGALFALLTSRLGDVPPPRKPRPGRFAWAELATPQPDEARAFYSRVLGWQADAGLFTAPGGASPATVAATASLRGIAPTEAASWTSAVTVEHLPSARSRALRLGGTVVGETAAVGTIGTMAVIRDNVGIVLGLFQPRSV